ncbi:MAG: GAF domain-containing protein [Acidobacteria bacterium]|nr:GAF domain-containing protein [Acidobacteriota bacterium]
MNIHLSSRLDDSAEATILSRGASLSDLPRVTLMIRWVVALSSIFILAALLSRRTPVDWGPVFYCGAALLLIEIALTLRTAPASQFHLGFTFLIIYFQLAGGVAAAVMHGSVRIIEWIVAMARGTRRQTPLSALFDVGLHVLATLGAAFIVQLALGVPRMWFSTSLRPLLGMAIFTGAYLVCHAALVSMAVYSRFGFNDVRTHLWPTTLLWLGISLGVGLPFAVLTWFLAQTLGEERAIIVIFILIAIVSAFARLNAGLRNINQTLRTMNRIGNAVNSTLNLSELVSVIAKESVEVLEWDRFFFAVRSDEDETMEITFVDQSGQETAHRTVPLGIGLTGRAISTGQLTHYEMDSESRSYDQVGDFEGGVGRSVPRSILVAPMKFGDQVLGAIGVQSYKRGTYGSRQFDVVSTIATQTAIALRNAQLFESEERANRERDEFVSLVTHEIKSPLTSIGGYTDLAVESIKEGAPEDAISSLQVVRDESGKVLRLVEDMLDASKMDSGRFSLEAGQFDLGSVVKKSVERLGARTEDHVFELNVQEPLPMIWGDEMRMEQVIENLLSNACKYSPEGMKVIVTLARRADHLELLVSDQGIGISPDKIDRVFERFYRVQENGQVAKGTGLGLYITREIVTMHGGTIEVESEPGVGSTFIVRLPLADPKAD